MLILIRLAVVFLLLGLSGQVVADDLESVTRSESSSLFNWQSNLRWTFDVSSRGVFNDNDSFTKNIVGLDVHKVFNRGDRDIAVLVFQPYIVNFSGSDSEPFFFDDRDTELTWRIANINYMAKSNGTFNIRLGHFEVPFGLEQNIDTNGTLRQYSFAERGIKADWGVSVNGVLPRWDYEISVSRGSGNDITDRDDPHIVAGRIGSPAHKNFVAGFSFFEGRVLGATGSTRRQRLGLDIAWYHKNWELLGELSAGEDRDIETALALLEVSWRNNRESLHLYTQLKQQRLELVSGRDSGSTLVLGMNQPLSRHLSVSSQWSKPVNRLGSQDNSHEFTVQLRYRL